MIAKVKSSACYLGRHDSCRGWTEPLPTEPIEPCDCSCHEDNP